MLNFNKKYSPELIGYKAVFPFCMWMKQHRKLVVTLRSNYRQEFYIFLPKTLTKNFDF